MSGTFSKALQIPVEGLHRLDSALAIGKGAILVSAHFGFYRLIKDILRSKGYDVWLVRARKSKNIKEEEKRMRNFSRFKQMMFERLHMRKVVHDEYDLFADFNIRPIVEVLKKNGIIVIMGDAQHAATFVDLDFLGHLYPFPCGYMSMAMNTGAPIFPAFAVDTSNGFRPKLVIEKPLILEKNGTPDDNLRINVEGFVSILESYVECHPYLFKIWTKENWFQKRLVRSRRELAKRY